jgi:hypothetical protein
MCVCVCACAHVYVLCAHITHNVLSKHCMHTTLSWPIHWVWYSLFLIILQAFFCCRFRAFLPMPKLTQLQRACQLCTQCFKAQATCYVLCACKIFSALKRKLCARLGLFTYLHKLTTSTLPPPAMMPADTSNKTSSSYCSNHELPSLLPIT